jgi:hypothetical protein
MPSKLIESMAFGRPGKFIMRIYYFELNTQQLCCAGAPPPFHPVRVIANVDRNHRKVGYFFNY